MRNRLTVSLFLLLAQTGHALAAAKASQCDEARNCHDNQLAAAVVNLLDPVEQSFVIAAGNHPNHAIPVAASEVLWRRAREKSQDIEVRSAVVDRLINDYLHTGLSADAISTYSSLPFDVQTRIIQGPAAFGMADVPPSEDFFVEQIPPLTAAGLAAAFAGAGRLAEADKVLDLAEKPIDSSDGHEGNSEREARIAVSCTRILIHANDHTDWFGWVFRDQETTHNEMGCSGAVKARAYTRLAAQHLDASGLPETWRGGVEPNDEPNVHSGDQDKLDAALKELPKDRDRIRELTTALAAIDLADARWIARRKRLEEQEFVGVKSTPHVDPSERDRVLAKTLTDRLVRPLINPYRIEEAKKTAGPSGSKDRCQCTRGAIRSQTVANVRWELAMSQDYDPSGEVPAAGYWLRRMELPDGPSQSFYLGIKEHLPFELVASDEPFIVDGELRLLVRRAAIDPKRIVFPPIGLNIKGEKALLWLRAKLDDITRDSDGDGLTDLAEQQLLLDPANPDSDGDGIPDGQDSLPNVALSKEPTARQRAFAAALSFLTHEPDLAISVGVPASGAFARRQATDERTLFVIADPEDLASISASRRIVVLPTSLDFKSLHKHPSFGVFYPMSISLRMVDDTHAELTYSASWQGGVLAMELRDGIWHIGTLSAWIT